MDLKLCNAVWVQEGGDGGQDGTHGGGQRGGHGGHDRGHVVKVVIGYGGHDGHDGGVVVTVVIGIKVDTHQCVMLMI